MLKKILYTLWLILFCVAVFFSIKNANFNAFINTIENRTFDARQNMIVNSGFKSADKNIMIAAIDDATYEYILENYGEWPLPRDVYVDLINYLEKQNPKIIAFDLMFVKSMKSSSNADNALAKAMADNKNIFTAMNLDNQPADLRKPVDIPHNLSVDVINNSPEVSFDDLTFANCRSILSKILNSTQNVGMINVSRADDGVLRKMPLFVRYKDRFYPQLGLKVGLEYLKQTENFDYNSTFVINKNSELELGDRKIFLDKDGSAILNWYGSSGTYTYVPMYKLIKASKGEIKNTGYDFKDKIIYFGTTASSLFDIKTVPVGRVYPGVEVQATYVNNLIDNNFIRKADKFVTVACGILLALLISIVVMKATVIVAALASLSLYVLYLITAFYALQYANLWLELVYPFILSLTAYMLAFIVKYIIKSRDFELQYRLATTDGLTDLYNHRYFQEQMKMQVENSKRYGNSFSLIILDIDFFKKFNDTFGHQAGDAVLKQVAQVLKRNVRATDIVCRYGGEEMSIILPNITHEEAKITAEKICTRIAEKKFILGHDKESRVTISLGVATFPNDGESASEIIDCADKRLYNAKHSGRNQVGK